LIYLSLLIYYLSRNFSTSSGKEFLASFVIRVEGIFV